MLEACNWCDDVLAETADVAVGDAWLPQFTADWRGTSIIVCRTAQMVERLRQGVMRGELQLAPISLERVIASQTGALRHRRAGLAYRLHRHHAAKRPPWRPRKRVQADQHALPLFNRIIQRLRQRTRVVSHGAFLRQRSREGVALFVRALRPYVWVHDALYAARMLLGRCKRLVKRALGRA
jgi:hypothetical protein